MSMRPLAPRPCATRAGAWKKGLVMCSRRDMYVNSRHYCEGSARGFAAHVGCAGDNAAGSPQTVPITGTGTGTNPPLAIDTRFFTCTGGVCDIGANSNVFVNNFFSTSFMASGGSPPYTWSGHPPTGLTLRPSGLLL